MRNKIITFLLLLNFVATISVGYIIYKDNADQANKLAQQLINKKPTVIEIEAPNKGYDEEFQKNVYQGMSRLMMGQNLINLRMLSLHHFVKPHDDEFYEHCPECQLEKESIINEDSVTSLEEE